MAKLKGFDFKRFGCNEQAVRDLVRTMGYEIDDESRLTVGTIVRFTKDAALPQLVGMTAEVVETHVAFGYQFTVRFFHPLPAVIHHHIDDKSGKPQRYAFGYEVEAIK